MAVMNFWVDADVDGRSTFVAGGPREEDGGMDVFLYQLDDGQEKRVVRIQCRAYGDELLTAVYINEDFVGEVSTKR